MRLAACAGAGVGAPAGASAPSGSVYAWGDNDAGQIGNGEISTPANNFDQDPRVPVPSLLPAGTSAVSVAGGQSHSLAATTSGAVYAWGYNGNGQLGTGDHTATTSPVQTQIPSGVAVTEVAAGYKQSLALTTTGTLYAWGRNSSGQAGTGSLQPTNVAAPSSVALPAGVAVAAIAAGANHDLAVSSTGAVYDWGLNADGQLGDGTTANSDLPVQVVLPGAVRATAVAGGDNHSLALTRAGKVYAWGLNDHGQLGDGKPAGSETPVFVRLPTGTVATAIAAGEDYSMALTSSGAIYAWGDNSSGNLGNGTTVDSAVPVQVQVPSGVTAAEIIAGGNRSHLLSTTGTVYDWGSTENSHTRTWSRRSTRCRRVRRL